MTINDNLQSAVTWQAITKPIKFKLPIQYICLLLQACLTLIQKSQITLKHTFKWWNGLTFFYVLSGWNVPLAWLGYNVPRLYVYLLRYNTLLDTLLIFGIQTTLELHYVNVNAFATMLIFVLCSRGGRCGAPWWRLEMPRGRGPVFNCNAADRVGCSEKTNKQKYICRCI